MDRDTLRHRFDATRGLSLELCRPLSAEDYRIQSMPDVSPPWWNLGHTSWFFARNVLHGLGRYRPDWQRLEFPLNSYYEGLGPRLARVDRGRVARPTTEEILRYRREVDVGMREAIDTTPAGADFDRLATLVEIGCQHEQQHQELLLTEIQHIRWASPPELRSPYRPLAPEPHGPALNQQFVAFPEGLVEIGNVEGGWAWDNETPIHRAWLDAFRLSRRLVTNAEYLEFLADGGYRKPLLWLSNGWAQVKAQGWEAPLYWERQQDDTWWRWSLCGLHPLDPAEPVSQISFYEAEAFARWAGARLPTEREWEHAARTAGHDPACANLLDGLENSALAPRAPIDDGTMLLQTIGDLWQWTTSHYEPYPGYRPFAGDLMEYNGKFMDNQRVLRGGSWATPRGHQRLGYRNFWPGDTRFQATGIRLAQDGG